MFPCYPKTFHKPRKLLQVRERGRERERERERERNEFKTGLGHLYLIDPQQTNENENGRNLETTWVEGCTAATG